MSRTEAARRRVGPAVLAGALLLALPGAPLDAQTPDRRLSGKFLLRHHPSVGVRYHQLQEIFVHVRADSGSAVELPEQRFRSSIYSAQEVTGRTADGIAVTMRVDSAFAEAALPTGENRRESMTHLHGLTGAVVFDDHLRFVRAAFVDAAGEPTDLEHSMVDQLKAFDFSDFPSRPVALGDSWEKALSMPMEILGLNRGVATSVRMTLLDLRLAGGDTTAVIGLAFRAPEKPIAVTEGEQRFTVRLQGGWTGEWHYSLTRGTPLLMDFGGSIRVDVTSADPANPPFSVRMDQRLLQRLIAAAGES